MLWLILSGLLFLVSIILLAVGYIKYDEDIYAPGWVFLVIAVIIASIWFGCYCGWNYKLEEMKMVNANIHNKIVKIEKMKQTYYNPPQNTTINIDMVNKDLAININNEIKDFELYILEVNNKLAEWKAAYKFKFWNACFIKPPFNKPIDLLNYNFLVHTTLIERLKIKRRNKWINF